MESLLQNLDTSIIAKRGFQKKKKKKKKKKSQKM